MLIPSSFRGCVKTLIQEAREEHDFSRAVKSFRRARALAPEVRSSLTGMRPSRPDRAGPTHPPTSFQAAIAPPAQSLAAAVKSRNISATIYARPPALHSPAPPRQYR